MFKNPIDRLIEAKEAKIAAAERAIDKHKIELAVLREAREAVALERVENLTDRTTPSPANGDMLDTTPRKGRSISEGWKRVLASIAKKSSGGADLDEILKFCADHGIQLQRPTLRAQMSGYVKRGYLGRTGDGKFFLALQGNNLLLANGIDVGKIPASAGEGGAPALTGAPWNT
jgi:hypothetical protein